MPIPRVTVIDQITIDELGNLSIRAATYIVEDDGSRIGSPSLHRHVLVPGDSLEGEPERVQRIAAVVWTPEVVAAHQAALEAGRGEMPQPEGEPRS